MSQGTERLARAKAIGSRVRTLREKQSITMQELAERAGVSRDLVARLEHGKRLPHAPNIRKVADALGVRVGYLLDGDADAADRTPTRSVREGVGRNRESAQDDAAPPPRGRVVLALATQREDGEDLEEILGGAEALGDLRKLLEGSRGGVLAGVGLGDYSDAPRLAPGEGLSDEIEAQRDSRPF